MFASEVWARSPLLTPAGQLATPFSDLFDLDAVDELLSRRGMRTPFLRMAKNGEVIDSKRFTRPGGAGAEIGDQVADDAVTELFVDGSTAVLQGLHRTWPPVQDFATLLAAELGHPVQVNAYITPPQSRGFAAHYDVHDVFVLQIAGEKRWIVHEPVLPSPLRHQVWTGHRAAVAAAATGAPVIDTVLRPGDSLYLPRGYLHAAEALGDVSVHLTVGIHPVTRAALVDALVATVAEAPELRSSLPIGVDLSRPDSFADDLSATVDALVNALRCADPHTVVARVRAKMWPASLPASVAPLRQAAAAASVGADTRVNLRPQLRCMLRTEEGMVILETPHRRIEVPLGSLAALQHLLSGDPVAVRDLPALDPEAAHALVARLLRESVLVPADT